MAKRTQIPVTLSDPWGRAIDLTHAEEVEEWPAPAGSLVVIMEGTYKLQHAELKLVYKLGSRLWGMVEVDTGKKEVRFVAGTLQPGMGEAAMFYIMPAV